METKKVKKKKLNISKLLILLLIIYLIVCGIYYLFSEPIRNIIITGNTFVTDTEIIEVANIKKYPPIFSLSPRKLKKKIKTIPLVEDVQIRRNLLFQLKINITESKIVFMDLSKGKLMLGNGNYIDNTNNYEGIPTLINYTPEKTLKKFAIELGKLNYGTLSGINEIEYSPSKNEQGETIDDTRFALKMNDGNMIYTNTEKCNTLKYYQQIYASLKNKKGILNLDSGNYKNFVFEPFGE